MGRETPRTNARYCPQCAGALMPRVLREHEPPRLCCVQCGFVFYLNPKAVSVAAFSHDNGVVLVRRAIEPAKGSWALPGGFIDLGETAAAAAIRETMEETGFQIRPTGILDVYSAGGNEVLLIVYAADVVGGSERLGAECSEIGHFAPESLPWDEVVFETTRAALRDYVRRFFPRVRVPRFV
jgi:8-oxo-dGTP diphosphatase